MKVPFEGEGRLGAFARKTHLLLLLGSHSYLVPSVHRHVFQALRLSLVHVIFDWDIG